MNQKASVAFNPMVTGVHVHSESGSTSEMVCKLLYVELYGLASSKLLESFCVENLVDIVITLFETIQGFGKGGCEIWLLRMTLADCMLRYCACA